MEYLKIFPLLILLVSSGSTQELACSSTNQQNVFSFTVPSASPGGVVNMMYVQHDASRGIPLSTTSFMDSMNQRQDVPRTDSFRRHDCTSIFDRQTRCENTYKMTPAQTEFSGGRTAFDRGHLTPANPFRYSLEAQINTFYCVNIAPQDPYSNQNPWFTVEDKAHKYFATTKKGYVMTGVCDANDRFSPTGDGDRIPACFWKLICYVDTAGLTQIVGFIGNNTLLNNNDAAGKALRTATTTTPVGQQAVMDVMTRSSFIMDAWDGAEAYLRKNRNANGAPTAANCKRFRTITDAVKNEWSNVMKEGILNHKFTEETDLELVKQYWNEM